MAGDDSDVWVPRVEDGEQVDIPEYTYPDYFTIKVYHGGCIQKECYVGGKFDYYDNVDKDRMSLVEVDNMVRQLNPAYGQQRIDYWYRVGDEHDTLMKLDTDEDVVVMCSSVPTWRLIILYLDHVELHEVFGDSDDDVFMYEDFFFSQGGKSGVVIEELPDSPRKKSGVVIIELPDQPRPHSSKGVVIREVENRVPTQASQAGGLDPKDKGKHKLIEYHSSGKKPSKGNQQASSGWGQSSIGQGSSGIGSTSGVQGSGVVQGTSGIDGEDFGLHDIDVLDYLQTFGGGEADVEIEDVGFAQGDSEEADSSEDKDYDPQFDDEDYDHYGTEDEDWLEEAGMEAASKGNTSRLGSKGQQSTVEEDLGHFSDDEDMFREDGSDDEQLQYFINSDGELEDVGIEFNPLTDMKKPKFCLGMKFADVKVLRDALREMAIQGGWEYVYIKNDKTRLRVVCKEDNCPFFLFASKMQHESTLQMKEYVPTHNCTRKFNNSMVRMRYLTVKFKDQITLNQEITPDSLAKTMSATIRARVSRSQAYRAKRAAMLEVEGSIREQYARLRDYGMELQRVDPATTIDIKCDFNNREKLPIFKRMYICLGALKKGFKAGCRAVIGLDGAHLKSCFGGQLLTGVGIDANNTSWVVAYAMVELESKDSWTWFLELLVKDLSIENEGAGWTFISDKQKGLKPAFEDVVPSAQIRFCARHLWTNFTKLFPGKVMKDQMWKAAKSTTLPYFLKEMEEMKSLDVDAYNWLIAPERPPKHWSRAYFRPGNNCDILINNMCESFNSLIVHARGKPPITMFEERRMKLMRRVQRRKDKMAAYEGTICPKARNVIEKNKIKAAEDCISTFNGGDQAEVENIEGFKNVVDLAARTCSCRRWDLTGIPCKHAISAIFGKREDVDAYVADCYLKSTYMSIYSNVIIPVNSMDMWSRSEEPSILPPQYSRQPGRPKTTRIKDASEKVQDRVGKLARVQRSLKCSNYNQVGHNLITCQRHLPPKERKTSAVSRKRKANNEAGQGSENQSKRGKKGPMTANELRQKVKERAQYQRKKWAAMKAASLAANRSAPTRGRPRQATSALTTSRPAQATSTSTSSMPPQAPRASTKQVATPARSSQRIRENSGKGNGK